MPKKPRIALLAAALTLLLITQPGLAQTFKMPGLEGAGVTSPKKENTTLKHHLAFKDNLSSHERAATISFDVNSSEVTASQAYRIHDLVIDSGKGEYLVFGFADRSGSLERNVTLSKQRTQAVSEWISVLSPDSEIVMMSSPVWKGEFDEGRRVEVLFSPL